MSNEEALFILEQMEELDFGARDIGYPILFRIIIV